MQLVTFTGPADGAARAGVLVPDDDGRRDAAGGRGLVVDLRAIDPDLPVDVADLLPAFTATQPDTALRARLDAAVAQGGNGTRHPLDAVTLLAPVPTPSKVIGIGLNYRDHAEETGEPLPDVPVVFAKFPNTVTGPFADVVRPALTSALDYEGELGAVIGRRCRDVAEQDALGVVAGYLVVNDVSARDVQNRTSQWVLGKSFDTFAPMGPALVTADEVGDPQRLDISTDVNDERRQQSNTAQMIFPVAELVARLSAVCTLEPGDVIATGTPGGIGGGFSPPRFLSPGDVVTVQVAGLGAIRSRVVSAP